MDFGEYQKLAVDTAVYPAENGLIYTTLGLNGEAGEVAEKVKKIIRDAGGHVSLDKREEIIKELGDVLWYTANLANELNVSLGKVAELNIDKLYSRKERGKLHGSGDDR